MSEMANVINETGVGCRDIPTKLANMRQTGIHGLYVALIVCLLAFGGYFAYSQHAKLQVVTAERDQAFQLYVQTFDELNNLHNELTLSKSQLDTTTNTLTTIGCQLDDAKRKLSAYELHGPITEFASYNDLIAWLKKDNTKDHFYISKKFECVDFSYMMAEHAMADGYWVFPAIDLVNGHMKCIAPIGNDIYAVEPQTGAVTLWAMKN